MASHLLKLCVLFFLLKLSYQETILHYDSIDDKCKVSNCASIRKCCPENNVYRKRSKRTKYQCEYSEEYTFNIQVYNIDSPSRNRVDFSIITNNSKNCVEGKKSLKLYPDLNYEDIFFIQNDGSLFRPNATNMQIVPFKEYCLETFINSQNVSEFSALICLGTQEEPKMVNFLGKCTCSKIT